MPTDLVGTIHIEKEVKSPVSRVYNAFKQTRTLKVRYDPRCRLEKSSREKLVGDNYPSGEILALVPNQTIVHRYSDIVSGLGIWSFVEKKSAKFTLVVFDHIDGYDSTDDRSSIAFYWKGLIENLAALRES